MAHEWKIGDWCEYGGVRCIVIDNNAPDGDLIIVPRFETNFFNDGYKQSHRFPTKDHRDLVHLPDCTGWDWQPPKPIEPPEGYRLLTEGETIEKLDKFWNCEQWIDVSNMAVGESYSYCPSNHCPIARKIEPTYAERQAAWVKENGLKVGDKVRVVRAAKSLENGWGNISCQPLEDAVGMTLCVSHIWKGDIGLHMPKNMDSACDTQNFPYFVLEKITSTTRPMTRDEFLAAWKQRGFCPLIDSQDDYDIVTRLIIDDCDDDQEIVQLYDKGWCSFDELSAWRFASDNSPLTVEE